MTHKKAEQHSQTTPSITLQLHKPFQTRSPLLTRAAGKCFFYRDLLERLSASQRVSECVCLSHARMAPKQTEGGGGRVKIPDKLTDAEKKKKKQENKAKANPEKVRRAEIVCGPHAWPVAFPQYFPTHKRAQKFDLLRPPACVCVALRRRKRRSSRTASARSERSRARLNHSTRRSLDCSPSSSVLGAGYSRASPGSCPMLDPA